MPRALRIVSFTYITLSKINTLNMALLDVVLRCPHCHLEMIRNGTFFIRFLCGHIEHAECFILSPLTNPPNQCSTCGRAHTAAETVFFK
ncbi:unnamed protein product [Adineta ricciae]|uniref:Uncharacterized protein n=1 Tax=Adineta ricciae TaxID=249248 RepID=A0A815TK34_ADIRI|nr:unnamed protein product [Adineta ricciae]CAF1502000.1 unnamed protein product [Adineta ricciae]